MRLLVLGARGMLARDLVLQAHGRGHEVIATDKEDLDVTDPAQVARIVEIRPDWTLNCSAYNLVDRAEQEPDAAFALNGEAPRHVCQASRQAGARALTISTDFVFDGTAGRPYTEEDVPNPRSVYARSKRQGEEGALDEGAIVIRTAQLFGPLGDCFPKIVLRLWEEGKELDMVSDIVACPTYTGDLARVMLDLVEMDAPAGLYHGVGPDPWSRADFAQSALEAYKEVTGDPRPFDIKPISHTTWKAAAERPIYSVLDCEKLYSLGIARMRPAHEAMVDFMRRLAAERS